MTLKDADRRLLSRTADWGALRLMKILIERQLVDQTKLAEGLVLLGEIHAGLIGERYLIEVAEPAVEEAARAAETGIVQAEGGHA